MKRKRAVKDAQTTELAPKRAREADDQQQIWAPKSTQPDGAESDAEEEEEEEEWHGAESENEMDETEDSLPAPQEPPSNNAGFEFLPPPGSDLTREDMLTAWRAIVSEAAAFDDVLAEFAGSLDQVWGTGPVDAATIDTTLEQIPGFESTTASAGSAWTNEEEEEEEEEVSGRVETGGAFAEGFAGDQESFQVPPKGAGLDTETRNPESLYVSQTAREIFDDCLNRLLDEIFIELAPDFRGTSPEDLRLLALGDEDFAQALESIRQPGVEFTAAAILEVLKDPAMAEI